MGRVRRVLPRLAILGVTAAGIMLLLAISHAGAEEPPPADPVQTLGGTVASLLPSEPLDLPLDALPALPSAASDPVGTLTTTLEPVLEPAQTLLTPQPTDGLANAGDVSSTPTAQDLDSVLGSPPPAAPGLTELPGLAQLTGPLSGAGSTPALPFPTLGQLPWEPPALGNLELPSALPSVPEGLDVPVLPIPNPHPAEPTGAWLRPATAPSSVTSPAGGWSTAAVTAPYTSSSRSTDTVPAGGEPPLPDPASSSGPARAPPNDAPRDPSHRGSTDHAQQYSALPGTDGIGVTRGESWHAGTDVELSNTLPEPSVSPD